jgi:hypothetical protein
MKIELTNNPAYRAAFTSQVHNTTFYEPAGDTAYHQARYVAAGAQNIYSRSGVTPELLTKMLDEMEKAVNNNKLSEVAVWINNLRYRTRYPVDEDAALRMAMIFYFVPGEDPDKVEPHWTEHKLRLVKEDPEAYSFFLPIGIANTPAYRGLELEISPSSLSQRRIALEGLTPQQ